MTNPKPIKKKKEQCPTCGCPVTVAGNGKGPGATHWYKRPGPIAIHKIITGWACDYTQFIMGHTALEELTDKIAELYGFTRKDWE